MTTLEFMESGDWVQDDSVFVQLLDFDQFRNGDELCRSWAIYSDISGRRIEYSSTPTTSATDPVSETRKIYPQRATPASSKVLLLFDSLEAAPDSVFQRCSAGEWPHKW